MSLENKTIVQVSGEEMERQAGFAGQVKLLLAHRYPDGPPLALIHTYGCQQNVADSQKIRGMLSQMGYGFTERTEDARLILFNTCAVREHAESRVFGNVGALKHHKKKHPETVVALCGCMMQQEHIAEKIKKSYPFVDLVFGTHVVHRLPELLCQSLKQNRRVFELPDMDGVIAEHVPVLREEKNRAFLSIMYGCNNFCSYCIVPYVRGRERSREPEDILNEAKELIADGVKEITLLGQNVNSYGKTLENPITFSNLLERICSLPGDFRVRFMTSHPKDCTKELLDTMARCEKAAKHLHLPFQSGSDRVLREMNRHYDREKYLSLIRYAKQAMPGLALTSDVIVGFPGESYEEFRETLSLIEEVEFSSLFTFIYSPREGTPAATMPDPVSREEKGRWFTELTDRQEEIATRVMKRMQGKTLKVYVTGPGKRSGWMAGRSSEHLPVEFPGENSIAGTFQMIKITDPQTYILKGEQTAEPCGPLK